MYQPVPLRHEGFDLLERFFGDRPVLIADAGTYLEKREAVVDQVVHRLACRNDSGVGRVEERAEQLSKMQLNKRSSLDNLPQ
ncbi:MULTISPECIES: hypothetical protein [Streptomyces]|jgi:hypothetical protein|uniref:Uncharacterized protein n=1 Tax=Streptomyces ardesiacus TaxID=285564 RepID=A0ABW8H698_9ACTN